MTTHSILAFACLAILTGCAGKPPPPPARAVKEISDPHRHVTRVHQEPNNPARLLDIVILATPTNSPPTKPVTPIRNSDGRYSAWLSAQKSRFGYEQDVLLLTDTKSSFAWRISSHDFPHRPISHITWITPSLLCFDIDTGPSYGVHYLFDPSVSKVIFAAYFHRRYD